MLILYNHIFIFRICGNYVTLIADLIFFNTIDKLIKLQVSEWKLHYDMLSKAGNKYVSIDEFALGHGKVMSVIGKRFFDGSKKINFNQLIQFR